MIQNISFTGKVPVRCLEKTYRRNGRLINEYSTKTGELITEITTDLGKGEKGIREIYRDSLGIPEKVVDSVYGRQETYKFKEGKVIQEAEDGIQTWFPANYWNYLTKVQ